MTPPTATASRLGTVVSRLYLFEVALVVVGAAFAAVFGTLSLTAVLVVSAVALAGPLLLRTVRTPWLALALLVVVEAGNLGVVLPGFAGVNAYTLALALAAGALVLGVLRGELRPVWTPLYVLAAVYLATQLISLLASVDTATGVADVVVTLKDLVFLVVVTALCTMTARGGQAVKAVVLALAALAGLTVVNQLAFQDPYAFLGLSQLPLDFDTGTATARHSGPQADPNFWARSLILFVPLALSLWAAGKAERRTSRRGWVGHIWLAAAGVLVAGLYLTQSRGGMLALVLLVPAWLLLSGGGYRRLLLLSPAALLLLPLVPGFGERLSTLEGLGAARSAVGDYSLVERVALQEVGLSIVAARPALGVGPGNFGAAFLDYRAESFVQPRVQDDPYFAHNLYLELAAEGGVVGLTGWLVLYGGAVLLATRALLLSPPGGPPGSALTRHLAVGTVAALFAWGVASVFLHLAHFRLLAVVLALAAALDVEARQRVAARPAVEGGPALQRSRRRRRAVVVAAASGLGVLALGVAVLDLRESAWLTRHSAVILPVDGTVGGGNAYEIDLLSRRQVMPTFAEIVASPRFEAEAGQRLDLAPGERDEVDVGVAASSQSTAVIVTATSADVRLSDGMSRGVLESARSYLNALDRRYTLGPAASSQPGPVAVQRLRLGSLVALLAIAGAAALLAYRAAARG